MTPYVPYIVCAMFSVLFFCILAVQTREILDLKHPVYVVFMSECDDGTTSVSHVVSFPGRHEKGFEKAQEYLCRAGFYQSSFGIDSRVYVCSNTRVRAQIVVSEGGIFQATIKAVVAETDDKRRKRAAYISLVK